MAGSMNKVLLIGALGRDPEVRNGQSGIKIVTFSMATGDTWKDKNTGEQKGSTEWHKIVIMNDRIADVAEKFLKKGSRIYIEGKLQTRKWTGQDGVEKYSTEILLGRFGAELVLLDKPGGGAAAAPAQRAAAPAAKKPSSWDEPGRDLDDEIPF